MKASTITKGTTDPIPNETVNIAGVDEAGRGPLAGPVVAAAVILDAEKPIYDLRDSKQLTDKQREILAIEIREKALAFGIGRAESKEIDRYNILQATLLAMKRAVAALSLQPGFIRVDGNQLPDWEYRAEAVIQGDKLHAEISAASIIAKVTRDLEMLEWDKRHPEYGFAQHKGYGTKKHMAALQEHGPCVIHRVSFAPVKRAMLVTE